MSRKAADEQRWSKMGYLEDYVATEDSQLNSFSPQTWSSSSESVPHSVEASPYATVTITRKAAVAFTARYETNASPETTAVAINTHRYGFPDAAVTRPTPAEEEDIRFRQLQKEL